VSRRLASLTLTALALGCGVGASPPAPLGAARISLAGSTLAGLSRVEVTVGPGDGPGFPPLVAQLDPGGAGASAWVGYLSAIPAGPGRRFEVIGTDPSGQVLFSGSAQADVVEGQAVSVVLILAAAAAPPAPVAVPVVDALTASADAVLPAGLVRLSAQAHSTAPAARVTYVWVASCGAYDLPEQAAVVWTAPALEGSCRLSVTMADGQGGAAVASLDVFVQAPVARP
jgi:hypothetical protein